MKTRKLISEIAALFASILVFRGVWTLLDRSALMSTDLALWSMLLAGVGVMGFCLDCLNK